MDGFLKTLHIWIIYICHVSNCTPKAHIQSYCQHTINYVYTKSTYTDNITSNLWFDNFKMLCFKGFGSIPQKSVF